MEETGPVPVLVVDDEPGYAEIVGKYLGKAYKTDTACCGTEALTKIEEGRYRFVLLDVQMPDLNGLQVLNKAREEGLDDGVTFIMISAFGTHDTVIECLKAGAYDYVAKPFNKDEIRLALAKAMERERLRGRVHELEEALGEAFHFGNIISRSPRMQRVFDVLRKVADYSTTVLIGGESGTGKELVARALHHASHRNAERFVGVNCGAIPENLLESELFGHVRGAFTDAHRDKKGLFEEANKGTIFLDEVGELPQSLQVKLLRVLQEREVRRVGDVKTTPVEGRVVAASVLDLAEAVKLGRFREDLYYRLNVIPIHLPPLRERAEDIPLLLQHFLQKVNQRHGTRVTNLTQECIRALIAYPWPGNVRELENLVERLVLLSDSEVIDHDALPPQILGRRDPARLAITGGDLSIKRAMRVVESSLIERALKQTGGHRAKAADLLEISPRTLLYKIKDYGIEA